LNHRASPFGNTANGNLIDLEKNTNNANYGNQNNTHFNDENVQPPQQPPVIEPYTDIIDLQVIAKIQEESMFFSFNLTIKSFLT
jgi:hypothetical protein